MPRTVLVTHATQYAGPGAVAAAISAGCRVIAHDASFSNSAARLAYQELNPPVTILTAQSATGIGQELAALGFPLDAAVINAVHPITSSPVQDITIEDVESTFASVVLFPIRVSQIVLPLIRSSRNASLVFVTSARESRPEPGFAVPTALRAACTAFAKALAIELAPSGIQVNVVAPNYLESEMYYPRATFMESEAGREKIRSLVPFGRLGSQLEVGELINFLASGRSPFVTGQVIRFTGGWAV